MSTDATEILYREFTIPKKVGELVYVPIRNKETNEELGHIVIRRANNNTAYIEWGVREEHQGKGIMTNAVRHITPHLLQHFHRLVAVIKPSNGRSQNLARRAGFRYEGTAVQAMRDNVGWYDAEFWAMLKEDIDVRDTQK